MEPVVELDERFSDEGASSTKWAEVRDVLESAETFWVTTVRSDGRPHVTPLVAVWLDDALAFCTGANEQKAVNLRGNQHVILSTGCNDWNKGIDVIVEGTATRVTDDAKLRRLAEAWTKKWDGRWHFDVANGSFQHEGGEGQALVFEVVPDKVLSFAKEQFAATRFRF
jgi:nitroimidazol reductase NimA-like FMN-containing flavoprotein (pyridoxamine 5'-phosphate oxidase superfamily)